MIPRIFILCAVSLLASALPTLANGFVYTKTAGMQCVDLSDPLVGQWSCPGPSGFSSDFLDEGMS